MRQTLCAALTLIALSAGPAFPQAAARPSRSGKSPASENESGVALTTPISSGGPPSSSSRRPARSLT